MPSLSVIIPTHRRPEILKKCLEHLEKQTIASEIEVIVVSDDTNEKCTMKNEKWVMSVRFMNVPPCHQGVARNEGVTVATGEYVMFIGDDIFLADDACEKHVSAHEEWKMNNEKLKIEKEKILNSQFSILNSTATLGFTTWDPAVGITPVMTWLEKSGWQFGYPSIEKYSHGFLPSHIQHKYTYTSHISVPLGVAKKFPFRSDVSLYGWEDVEWGMRLRDAGVSLFYEPSAKALHHHHITLEDSLQRMETLGRSAVEIAKNVPEFDRVPRGWKLCAYKILAMLPTMAGRHRHYFLFGIDDDRASFLRTE